MTAKLLIGVLAWAVTQLGPPKGKGPRYRSLRTGQPVRVIERSRVSAVIEVDGVRYTVPAGFLSGGED